MSEANQQQANVFLSYAREDRPVAAGLARRLEAAGLTVWWDFDLIGGQDYRAEIQDRIDAADRVLVLWSAAGVQSHFVIDEAARAKRHGTLVPVRLDEIEPPLGFGGLHCVTYRDADADFEIVLAAIERRTLPDPGPDLRRRRLVTASLAGVGVGALGLGALGFRTLDWQGWIDGIAGTLDRSAAADLPAQHAASATTGRVPRIALVVGNNDYANLPSLENAVNDAMALTARLRRFGFDVIAKPNATRSVMLKAIAQFKSRLARGGVGLFYFAGQAAYIDGRDLILPADTPPISTQQEFEAAAIDISDVRAPVEVFLSALWPRVTHAGLSVGAPNAPTPSKPQTDHGVLTFYAAGKGELAFDGVGLNSPFAEALLAEFDTEGISVSDLARRVRKRVRSSTQGQQNPVLEDATHVDFAFDRPTLDPDHGILRLVFLDSCRDNPFNHMPAK